MTNEQRKNLIPIAYISSYKWRIRLTTRSGTGQSKHRYFWRIKLKEQTVFVSVVTGEVFFDDDHGFDPATPKATAKCDELIEYILNK